MMLCDRFVPQLVICKACPYSLPSCHLEFLRLFSFCTASVLSLTRPRLTHSRLYVYSWLLQKRRDNPQHLEQAVRRKWS
jgi:hypothetical protein